MSQKDVCVNANSQPFFQTTSGYIVLEDATAGEFNQIEKKIGKYKATKFPMEIFTLLSFLMFLSQQAPSLFVLSRQL